MFLIKGYLVKHYESIIIDADTREQAIAIYNRKFERGELDDQSQDLDLELMQISNEKENK